MEKKMITLRDILVKTKDKEGILTYSDDEFLHPLLLHLPLLFPSSPSSTPNPPIYPSSPYFPRFYPRSLIPNIIFTRWALRPPLAYDRIWMRQKYGRKILLDVRLSVDVSLLP